MSEEVNKVYKNTESVRSGAASLVAQLPVLFALYAVLRVRAAQHIPADSNLHYAIVHQTDGVTAGANLCARPSRPGASWIPDQLGHQGTRLRRDQLGQGDVLRADRPHDRHDLLPTTSDAQSVAGRRAVATDADLHDAGPVRFLRFHVPRGPGLVLDDDQLHPDRHSALPPKEQQGPVAAGEARRIAPEAEGRAERRRRPPSSAARRQASFPESAEAPEFLDQEVRQCRKSKEAPQPLKGTGGRARRLG